MPSLNAVIVYLANCVCSMMGGRERDMEGDRPYGCPVPGCKKRYKNVNGIKYHARHGHKNEASKYVVIYMVDIYSYFYLLTLSRLQKVQNSAAKLVFKAHKYDHVQPLLQALCWLPVQAQIDYKLSAICHNVFSDSSPACLSDLTVYTPSR